MSGPWRVAGVSTDGSVADIKDDTHCVANGVRVDKAELICQEHNAAASRPAPTAAADDVREAAQRLLAQSMRSIQDGRQMAGDIRLVARYALAPASRSAPSAADQEIERLRQIAELAEGLMLAHHLHERESQEFWAAYYRLSNAVLGNPLLSPGEQNPLAAPAPAPRTTGEGER